MPKAQPNASKQDSWHAPRATQHLPALATLAFLVLAYMSPVLPPFATGASHLGADITNQYLPSLYLLRTSLRHGCVPYWNPYSFSGTPLVANMQRSALFYPTTLAYCLFPVESAIPWVEAIHLFFAAAGMYFLVYHYTSNRWSGLFAATGWAFGGFFANRILMGHLPQLEVCAYLPLMVLLLERILVAEHVSGYSLAIGLIGALCVFAGYPESLFMIGVFVMLRFAAEIVWRVLTPRRNDGATSTRLGPLFANGIIAAVIFAGVSAAQLLPTMELIGLSARIHTTYAGVQARSMPAMNLATFALPDFLGGIAQRNAVQGSPIGEMSAYSGVSTLLLALSALVLRPRRDRIAGFYAVASLLATMLSLGGETPLYSIAFALPGFRQIGAPMRWVFLLAFTLPILAGLGLHALLDLRVLRRDRCRQAMRLAMILAAVGALTTIIYLLLQSRIERHFADLILARYPEDAPRRLAKLPAFCHEQWVGLCAFTGLASLTGGLLLWRGRTVTTRSGRGFAVLICVLLALDLAGFDLKDILAVTAAPVSLLACGDFRDLPRLLPPDSSYRVLPLPDSNDSPDQNLLAGISSAVGYDPIELMTYRQMLDTWEGLPDDQIDTRAPMIKNWASPIADRWAVRFVLTRTRQTGFGLRPIAHKGQVWVYEKASSDPRAYVVYKTEQVTNRETTLARLAQGAGGFSSGMAFVAHSRVLSGAGDAQPATNLRQPDPNHLSLDARSEGAGLLVIADTYYPGWKAYVDGQEAPIVPVNVAMRGIYLKSGSHHVFLSYGCPPLRIGLWISGVTLVLAFTALGLLSAWISPFHGTNSRLHR